MAGLEHVARARRAAQQRYIVKQRGKRVECVKAAQMAIPIRQPHGQPTHLRRTSANASAGYKRAPAGARDTPRARRRAAQAAAAPGSPHAPPTDARQVSYTLGVQATAGAACMPLPPAAAEARVFRLPAGRPRRAQPALAARAPDRAGAATLYTRPRSSPRRSRRTLRRSSATDRSYASFCSACKRRLENVPGRPD
jgi:hypothetical protein